MIRVKRNAFFVMSGMLAFVAAAQAAPIAVPNGDFEQDAASRAVGGTLGQSSAAIPSWTKTGGSGTFHPSSSTGSFWNSYDAGEHGEVVAYTQSPATISQTLTQTYQPNTVYTLSVQVGDSYENVSVASGPAYEIQLMAGDVILATASDTVFPNANTSIIATAIFDSATNLAALGEQITIMIRGYTPGSATFDNVTLDAVPEPAALSLVGLGALGMLRRRRA